MFLCFGVACCCCSDHSCALIDRNCFLLHEIVCLCAVVNEEDLQIWLCDFADIHAVFLLSVIKLDWKHRINWVKWFSWPCKPVDLKLYLKWVWKSKNIIQITFFLYITKIVFHWNESGWFWLNKEVSSRDGNYFSTVSQGDTSRRQKKWQLHFCNSRKRVNFNCVGVYFCLYVPKFIFFFF